MLNYFKKAYLKLPSMFHYRLSLILKSTFIHRILTRSLELQSLLHPILINHYNLHREKAQSSCGRTQSLAQPCVTTLFPLVNFSYIFTHAPHLCTLTGTDSGLPYFVCYMKIRFTRMKHLLQTNSNFLEKPEAKVLQSEENINFFYLFCRRGMQVHRERLPNTCWRNWCTSTLHCLKLVERKKKKTQKLMLQCTTDFEGYRVRRKT